jgi:hypothetical protein
MSRCPLPGLESEPAGRQGSKTSHLGRTIGQRCFKVEYSPTPDCRYTKQCKSRPTFIVGYALVRQADACTPRCLSTPTVRTNERRTGPFPGLVDAGISCPNSSGDTRMGSIRRSFNEEYKAPAVTLVMDDHASMADVARNIGAHEMTLGKWPKDKGAKGSVRFGNRGARSPHQSSCVRS